MFLLDVSRPLELQLLPGRHVTEGLREFRFDAAETTSIIVAPNWQIFRQEWGNPLKWH